MIAKNTQETFILFHFISRLFYFSGSELMKYNKLDAKRSTDFTLILFRVSRADC